MLDTRFLLLAALVLLSAPTQAAPAGKEPAGIAAAAVVDDVKATLSLGTPVAGLARPVLLTHAGDGSGRVFVVEQGGLIRVLVDGKLQPTPWLDATRLLGASQGEQGLLGLAFHPGFKKNGRFFIGYTDKAERDAVAELQVKAGAPDWSTLKVWLAIDDPAANHNGGHVLFGPDGKLWVGTGDGGGANDPWKNAQNPRSLLGKMLRLDVDTPGKPPEIWARGLRNPWRYAFDAANGDLWVADVGQNAWEEVDVVKDAVAQKNLDFGWSKMEGRVCFAAACEATDVVVPALVYSHDFAHGGGCSITGGVVVSGRFLFADYCTGEVWAARRSGSVVKQQSLLQSGRRVSSFGVDEAGRPWLVDHQGAVVPLVLQVNIPALP